MRPLSIAIATITVAFSGAALAGNCPNDIKAVNAKMSTAKLSEADSAKVKKLLGDAETAHKAGKHDEAQKAVGEARKIVGA